MITKDPSEIEKLRKSGHILAATLDLVAKSAKPGVSAWEMDQIAEAEIRKAGGRPAFKNYQPDKDSAPFPAALCVSINDEVVHGIPSKAKVLQEGDIVGLDLGVDYEGFFTDAAITVAVGKIDKISSDLIQAATEALEQAVQNLAPGKTTGDIGNIIESTVKQYNFKVVRELVGHGVGRSVHEDPEIPCFGQPGAGAKFVEGMVVAIEPMVNAGGWKVDFSDDGWTIETADGSRSSHMEHTLLVTSSGCEILTRV